MHTCVAENEVITKATRSSLQILYTSYAAHVFLSIDLLKTHQIAAGDVAKLVLDNYDFVK